MSLRDVKLFTFTEYNLQALCMLNWKEKDFWKKERKKKKVLYALWYIETEFQSNLKFSGYLQEEEDCVFLLYLNKIFIETVMFPYCDLQSPESYYIIENLETKA